MMIQLTKTQRGNIYVPTRGVYFLYLMCKDNVPNDRVKNLNKDYMIEI